MQLLLHTHSIKEEEEQQQQQQHQRRCCRRTSHGTKAAENPEGH